MTQAKAYSEETARQIDAEVALIINRAYKTAKDILEENIDLLHALTDLLIEKETVMGVELDDLIASMRPDFDFFGRKNTATKPKKSNKPDEKMQSDNKQNPEDSKTDDVEPDEIKTAKTDIKKDDTASSKTDDKEEKES
jgi:cell division protease FtsH